MARIKTLPPDVTRQIAAGEVVERPASVVKELVENALDAGAGRITIRTAGAGVRLIEVNDDGCGMPPDDVAMAPKNFSTSKISRANDLVGVATYGFRGEALASISAVSKLEIISSDTTNGEGWLLASEGNTITENKPAPHEKGTTVRVQDLFFNTPARKKFLKSDSTERQRMLDTVLSFALIAPSLEVHYTDEDKPVLDLVPGSIWRGRIAAILGGSTMDHMVDAKAEQQGVRVRGFVSLPTYTRSNRSQQFIYVNRRLVREKTILHAVSEAYRSVIPIRRFPAVVLDLELPPDQVDVNVHPSKLEVRLKNERLVHETVRRAIKQALTARAEDRPGARYASSVGFPGRIEKRDAPFPAAPPFVGGASGGVSEGRSPAHGQAGYEARVKDAFADYMKGHGGGRDLNPQLSLQTEVGEAPSETTVETLPEKVTGEEGLFWQFNNTYIFIQVRGGVVIIDQHAAHERVIFDTSKKRLEKEIPVSQQILFPIHLELSLNELEVFKSSRELFERLGFHLEPFGGKSILVRGYPHGLKNWNEGKLLREIFDDILQDRAPGDTHADKLIASFACRSAVKAGQKLKLDEMRTLADQLFAVENPYSCPHGRPTIQRLALEELERWFMRK